MNTKYYETLDDNFNNAVLLYENDYSHSELIDFLKNGNVVQKQISAIRLDTITSKEDASVLIDNLTGQDGKVREAVSLRLKDFLSDKSLHKFFESEKFYNVFLDAIIDINGNICRNVISAICNLKENDNFCKIFTANLLVLTTSLLNEIAQFSFQEGKYKVNKEVFKLYWCLETIYEFYEKFDLKTLKPLLFKAKEIQEYTIREKVAKILTKEENEVELLAIKNELKSDNNYYVRRF